MDRNWLGTNGFINAINPIMIMVFIPIFAWLIYPPERFRRENGYRLFRAVIIPACLQFIIVFSPLFDRR